MPEPYDYSRAMPKMPDPFGSYARGADLGYGIQQRELQIQKQGLEIQQQQADLGYGIQQRELETQQQQVELANQRAAAKRRVDMQDAIAGLMNNKSPSAIMGVMTEFPETIEILKPLFSEYTTQELQQKISTATPIYAALLSKSPDLAAEIYKQQAIAAENSGDNERAAIAWAKAEQVLEAPDVATTELGLTLATAMGLDNFGSTFEKLGQQYRAMESQPGAMAKQDLELIQLAMNMGMDPKKIQEIVSSYRGAKIPKDTIANLLSIEAGNVSGKLLDPEKRYQASKDLREEYNKRTSDMTVGRVNYDKMLSSAQIKEGLGDVALITSFMKMLDEGSVVRDSEFATARDTAGLFTSLKNLLTKVQGGQFLTDTQRKTFVNLAKQYLDAAEKDGAETRRSMEGIVKRLGLNRADVFVDAIEGAPATSPLEVRLPDGRAFKFNTEEEANAFRAKAGL